MTPSRIGTFLHDSRLKAGLSQKEVSDHCGYNTAQVISDWERGVRSPPSIMLKKLVKLYGVSMEKFFEVVLEEKTLILENKLRKTFGLKSRAGGR
jgi:transcriptional regulator with XRE-family HTH domain